MITHAAWCQCIECVHKIRVIDGPAVILPPAPEPEELPELAPAFDPSSSSGERLEFGETALGKLVEKKKRP